MSCTLEISPKTVALIERRLDHLEVCGIIFLLYDNVEVALQEIFIQKQLPRRCRSVLDSALYNVAVNYEDGPLARWARSCENKQNHWQEQLLESLMIIKNYSIINLLGRSRSALQQKYLPQDTSTATYVDKVRKFLFLMLESLTVGEWKELQYTLTDEARQSFHPEVLVPSHIAQSPECFILFMLSHNVLQRNDKRKKMDFRLLRSSLKRMSLHHWVEKLVKLEQSINEDWQARDHITSEILPDLPKFQLDRKCPGTILIFNIENYSEVVSVSSKPLSERKGSYVDRERLEDTFNLLGFQVVVCNDPLSTDIIPKIKNTLTKFCRDSKDVKADRCYVVAILAHGNKEGVFGTDGVTVKWTSIRSELRSPETAGLPRLLVIQACKGDALVLKNNVVEDGPNEANPRDLFELSATVTGFVAYRSPNIGSFFIHSLCKNILLYGRDVDIGIIARLVNCDLSEQEMVYDEKFVFMTPEFNDTASKFLYLGIPEGRKDEAMRLVKMWKSQEESFLHSSQEKHPNKNLTPHEGTLAVQDHNWKGQPLHPGRSHHIRNNPQNEKKIFEDLKALLLGHDNNI